MKLKTKLKICLLPIVLTSFASIPVLTTGVQTNFNHFKNKDIYIPDEYFNIDESGVCYGLKNIKTPELWNYNTLKIPNNVKKIADHAFSNMFDLYGPIQKLILNNKLEVIGNGAFNNCTAFGYHHHEGERIRNPINFDECPNLETIGNEAFFGCWVDNETLDFSKTKIKSIGASAFRYSMISSLALPKTLTDVGNLAFADHNDLHIIDFEAYDSIPSWLYAKKMIFYSATQKTNAENYVVFQTSTNTAEEWVDVLMRQNLSVQWGPYSGTFKANILKKTTSDCFNYNTETDTITGFSPTFLKHIDDYNVLSIPQKYTNQLTNEEKYVKSVGPKAFSSSKLTTTKKMRLEFEMIDDGNLGIDSIDESAFENCIGLFGTVIFPKTLVKIEKNAFKNCTGLNSVDFSQIKEQNNSFKEKQTFSFKEYCFEGCTNLQKLILPIYSKIEFEVNSFAKNSSLSTIDLSGSKEKVEISGKIDKEKGLYPFKDVSPFGIIRTPRDFKDSEAYVKYFEAIGFATGSVGVYTTDGSFMWEIGSFDSSTTIADVSFSTIGNDTLKGLKTRAYEELINVESINIPKSITTILDSAFEDKLWINNPYIHEWPFYQWNLKLNFGLRTIGNKSFKNCFNLIGTIDFPTSLINIGDEAFANCSHLKGSFILPPYLQTIGNKCFSNCNRLFSQNLTLPTSIEKIGSFAFEKTNILKMTFPSITSNFELMDYALAGISGLVEIDLSSIDINKLLLHPNSFYTSTIQGKYYVASGTKAEWEKVLKNHGAQITDGKWSVVEK